VSHPSPAAAAIIKKITLSSKDFSTQQPVNSSTSAHHVTSCCCRSLHSDKIPSVILQEGQADYGKPTAVDIAELIAGKKVGEYLCCHVAITVVSNLTLLIIGYLTLKI